MAYLRPSSTHAAVEALAERDWTIVSGATDHYPARVGRAPTEDVLDVSGIDGLRHVARTEAGWTIGARTTWRDILDTELPSRFDGLKAAARTIGGVQIQNRATLVGNVCNASPAADGVPVLLSLDASIELTSLRGVRQLPLHAFVAGNRATLRRPDELVTAIHIPAGAAMTRSAFLKLGSRSSLVISIVMVAGTLALNADGVAVAASIAVGACGPVAVRLPGLEARVVGSNISDDSAWTVSPADLSSLAPIDDIRGSATYRREAARVLVTRLLAELRT